MDALEEPEVLPIPSWILDHLIPPPPRSTPAAALPAHPHASALRYLAC